MTPKRLKSTDLELESESRVSAIIDMEDMNVLRRIPRSNQWRDLLGQRREKRRISLRTRESANWADSGLFKWKPRVFPCMCTDT